MTERGRTDQRSTVGGVQVHVSKLLVACLVAAVVATAALIVTLAVGMPGTLPPPVSGPNGQLPPPPNLDPLAIFPVVTGLFVLAWLAVAVVFARDQILLRLQEMHDPAITRQQINDLLHELRAELAADRERELRALGERIAAMTSEYGEQRETDGYLNGMRVATTDEAVEPNVRSLRRPPPPR
jgi:hypothetical protein